jgi:serine/threonine protein kinase
MPIAQLTQLDHYILRRRLEDGGYYANFESTHPSSGEKVIVSAFSPRFVQTEGFRERFAECVQRSQRARSMHLAQCHGGGFDEKADTPYIVQEAIDGRTLAEVLQGGEVLGPGWVAERIAEAAEGLKALRAQGVLHRDIRPGSLRFARDGTLKVFNLGRAGLLPPNMFRVGLDDIVGDPRYLAPEAALGKAADLRSDLYSLAATAYHLLAGKPPFQGNSFDQLARQHASSQPEPLPELDRDIPATLWDIIRDCMAKDPAKRYTDYDTFLLDWKACMRASGLTGAKGAPGAASLMAASPGRADSGGPLAAGRFDRRSVRPAFARSTRRRRGRRL